ncbi:MAG: histidine kinase dimerization/phosphoacceptor domain-containing protein [Actinomycetota bacterium]|nr:histidine kinase dimerization/phosphoacceptor domain-containing protein [Actinomycetota bacterium]
MRRRRPLPVLLLVLGASWLQFELGGQVFQPWFALILGLYAVGSHAERRAALVGAGVTAVAVLDADVPRLMAGAPVDEVLPGWFVLTGIFGLGRWVRSRRSETAGLAARAAAAERDRAAHAAQAVAEERARIARELHDLVAHSMGVIVIQSQAGLRAVDTAPDLARRAFSAIETTGRQGMGELRRLLALLTGPEDGSVAPQPSLREVEDLVGRVRAAGLPVELQVAGDLGACRPVWTWRPTGSCRRR